jgi:hypothetical protein
VHEEGDQLMYGLLFRGGQTSALRSLALVLGESWTAGTARAVRQEEEVTLPAGVVEFEPT